jgi:hypothetical protein
MGANATTFVPSYTSGEVLTAANLSVTNSGIPVFATTVTRDAAFGGTGEKTLAPGQFCYLESTGKLQVYTGSAWSNVGSQTQVTAFTASGTFTPPTGVTYAIAYIRGGGGSTGTTTSGNIGGTSSVAFAGGTISATGGTKGAAGNFSGNLQQMVGTVNSGQGAKTFANDGSDAGSAIQYSAFDGALITAGGAVTAGVGITVTVGAGGAAGSSGAAGGTGYVYIQYEV